MSTEPIHVSELVAQTLAALRAHQQLPDLTVTDVADRLHCSASTVYLLVTTGKLASYKLNGTDKGAIRVTEQALADYRTSQTQRDPWARTQPRRRTTNRKAS